MIILQDTREQAPLNFNHPYITEVICKKLDCGDYGCQFTDGHTPPIYFERKSLVDLFGTLGKGYKRFKREIQRAQESNISLIIAIEGSITKILNGTEYSTMEGISVLRRLITLEIKYGIRHKCFNSRDEMSLYIAEYYCGIGKRHVEQIEKEVNVPNNKQ
jgi:ERCC4-type nuclease